MIFGIGRGQPEEIRQYAEAFCDFVFEQRVHPTDPGTATNPTPRFHSRPGAAAIIARSADKPAFSGASLPGKPLIDAGGFEDYCSLLRDFEAVIQLSNLNY